VVEFAAQFSTEFPAGVFDHRSIDDRAVAQVVPLEPVELAVAVVDFRSATSLDEVRRRGIFMALVTPFKK
jgi:hypothetical protein